MVIFSQPPLRAPTIAIAIVGRAITDTKMDAKRIKRYNFTRSNREESNIAIVERAITLERETPKKKQRTDTK